MSVIGFPNPVNEKAARTVAAGVALIAALTLALAAAAGTGWLWLVAVLAAGFVLRVLSGPRLSPLGQLATRVVAPRLGEPVLVAGPPKRFAQAMGATMTLAGTVALALGAPTVTVVLLAAVVVAATLESVFALCLGCVVFGWLMRAGVVPPETCEACANIRSRPAH
ncbi:DUF4395 domain-containing protein [Jatrophihabitans fulvus]